MYRDDDLARVERANALIEEIGRLEREKVAQAATDDQLDAARRELARLQAGRVARPPGVVVHVAVFAGTAVAAALAYTLLLAG